MKIKQFKTMSLFSKTLIFLGLITAFFVSSCSDDKDDIYPEIDMSGEDAFPLNCSVVHPGETFTFRAVFTDNRELGAFSLEIHDNFDHHTHSTDAMECKMEPEKKPVQPFHFIEDHDIPPGMTKYEAGVNIFVPDTVDTGDYHLMVRLSDASGFTTIKGIAMKILAPE